MGQRAFYLGYSRADTKPSMESGCAMTNDARREAVEALLLHLEDDWGITQRDDIYRISKRINAVFDAGQAHERERESQYEIRLANALRDTRKRLQAVVEFLAGKQADACFVLTMDEEHILALAQGDGDDEST